MVLDWNASNNCRFNRSGYHCKQLLRKKYGGSKTSERIATIATIIGSFIIPPFGIILVPFLAVLVTEYIVQKNCLKAIKVGSATVVGFLGGSIAKVLIQLLMIGIFIISVIF